MASTAKNSSVENVLKTTLQYIEQHEEAEYKMLQKDSQKMDELTKVIRSAAEEYMRLEAIQDIDKNPGELARHLPPQRIKMIKEGLTIPTYKININRREKGKPTVDFTRDGKTFKPTIELATLNDIDYAKMLQYASIIVEAVLLVLQAVGIKVEVSESVIDKVAQDTVQAVENSSLLQKAVENLQKVFEDSSSSAIQKATAIFYLIKDSYSASILWNIIKGLCSNMSTWDWIKTSGIVTAMIVAALATDGAALIAKIILALNSAYEFVKKVVNLTELDSIKKKIDG